MGRKKSEITKNSPVLENSDNESGYLPPKDPRTSPLTQDSNQDKYNIGSD